MIRIISQFRKHGFKGNYINFQYVVGDGNNYNQGLFKIDLLSGEIVFQ